MATLATLLTYVVYLGMDYVSESAFAVTLVATLFAALLSEIMARLLKAPATVFLIPSILPFVPGAGLYDTMNYFVRGDIAQARIYGGQALLMVFGIAVGLSVVASIFQIIYPVKNKIHIMNRYKRIIKRKNNDNKKGEQ
jgi:uncharacterized membrane protein YjjB (DUF3815 family)